MEDIERNNPECKRCGLLKSTIDASVETWGRERVLMCADGHDFGEEKVKGERNRLIIQVRQKAIDEALSTLKEVLEDEIMINDLKERIYKKVKDKLI